MTPKKWARDLHAENFEGIKGMKIFHFVFKQVSNLTPKPKDYVRFGFGLGL